MAHRFNISASIKSTINKALGVNLLLVLCINSKLLYNCFIKLGTTQEKRLIINIICLRQAYKRREIIEVKWIKGDSNPADSITKNKPLNALNLLLDTNII
jgi:hypothetical protein